MNYSAGAHECDPKGRIQYSSTPYKNKHMCHLGLPFMTDKFTKRYKRAHAMQQMGMATQYTDRIDHIQAHYLDLLHQSHIEL
jgi:hypothetical protein